MNDLPGNLPQEQIEILRSWHERAYREMASRETLKIEYLGLELEIPPTVFAPTPMSDLLGRAVLEEVQEGDRVLDMGTGCGVNAILAASRSTDVIGCDVNPDAIECAERNAVRNGVEERVEIRMSDVFSNVEGQFDLIIFDPPFRWFRPRDMLEMSIADENYQSLTRFFSEVLDRLSPGGRILLFFGTSGDATYLDQLIERTELDCRRLETRSLVKEGVTVEYFVYRLEKGGAS